MTTTSNTLFQHLSSYLEHEYKALKNQDFQELSCMALAKVDLMEKFEKEMNHVKSRYNSIEESPYADAIKSVINQTNTNQSTLTGMIEGLQLVISAFEKVQTLSQTTGIYTADGSPYENSSKNTLLGCC
jgi:hypothetical protein